MLPYRRLQLGQHILPLTEVRRDLSYQWGLSGRTPKDYLADWPVTSLLILRKGEIWHESYRFARTAELRFTSWSMAKSVTSLLLGAALDRRLVHSLDDTAERYLPELRGTLHGACTLRNLANMSSGAEVIHERDNLTIYPSAFTGKQSSIRHTVANWNNRREEQGRTFNYNELCPLTVGMVIRKVTNRSLSEFAEEVLWRPLGAEGDATWTTDWHLDEFNCIGFAARLRDWGRLGMLVAGRGRANGQQIISTHWIDECTNWTPADQQVRYGAITPPSLLSGYKAFMWHAKSDGSQVVFNGYHGQRVFIDMPTQTVLVQTAVDHDGRWQQELYALFTAATKIPA
jgi:CubicO group peptidase (beta-lactamase class C family)